MWRWLVLAIWMLAVPAQAQFTPFGIAAPQATGGTCAQATTFLSRTSGLSVGTKAAYTAYICGLVTDGVITSGATMGPSGGTPYCGTKLDALWVMATTDATTANLDLCGHTAYSLAPSGVPDFTANQGYIGRDGAATQVWSASQINAQLSGGGSSSIVYTGAPGTYATVYANAGVTSGKYYWEAQITSTNPSDFIEGVVGHGLGNTSTTTVGDQLPGLGTDSVGIYVVGTGTRVDWYVSGGSVATYPLGFTVANGDVFGFALDLTNNTVWFRDVTQNSGWYGSAAGDPATNSNGFSLVQSGLTITSSPVVPGALLLSSGDALVGFFGSWTGTAPAGFSGFSPYLNTSFNPVTAGGNFAQNNSHMAIWSLTNAQSSNGLAGVAIGSFDANATISQIIPWYGDGNAYGAVNANYSSGQTNATVSDSLGYYAITRTASTIETLYKGGVQIATNPTASQPMLSLPIYILNRNANGNGGDAGAGLRIAMANVGAGLSAPDITALYTRGCTFLTTVRGSC
jgi:hypothetical protein